LRVAYGLENPEIQFRFRTTTRDPIHFRASRLVLIPIQPSTQRLLRPSPVAAEQLGVEPDPSATAIIKFKNALIFVRHYMISCRGSSLSTGTNSSVLRSSQQKKSTNLIHWYHHHVNTELFLCVLEVTLWVRNIWLTIKFLIRTCLMVDWCPKHLSSNVTDVSSMWHHRQNVPKPVSYKRCTPEFITLRLIWYSEDRESWYILIIKPTRCTDFSNLLLE